MDTFEVVDQELLLAARARLVASEIVELEATFDDGAAPEGEPANA